MVNSRTEATLDVVGLEKALAKMENFLLEFRASRASPVMIFPTFDGSEALAWLARANQYFLINKTPLDRRVDVAINAISGPAMPWLKLLLMRCSSLSWDKFTQELLRRFGDAAIATVRVAKIQPKIPPTSNDIAAIILPTMTAPLLSSSPSTTAQQEISAINTSTHHPDLGTKKDNTKDNSAPLPLPVQHAFLPPVRRTLPPSTILPTPATVTAPLLSASPNILQFRLSFPALLRCLVPAAGHQSTPMGVPFPDSLFSSAAAPFSYLVMLRFLHIVGNLLWFDAMATTRKHEFEPPPDRVMCFEF